MRAIVRILRRHSGLALGALLPLAARAGAEEKTTPQGQVLVAEPPPGSAAAAGSAGAPSSSMGAPQAPAVAKGAVVAQGQQLAGDATAGPVDRLAALRLVSIAAGEAHVQLDGQEHTLTAGRTIAGDLVRRVDAERIVFARSEGEGRQATVLVTFGPDKRAHVVVLSTLSGVADSEVQLAK